MGILAGKNIQRLRKAAGMKQTDLAKLLHVSNKTISSWESGRTEPDMATTQKLCNIFKCKKTDIMGEDEFEPEQLYFSEEEIALIMAYRELTDDQKTFVANSLDPPRRRLTFISHLMMK